MSIEQSQLFQLLSTSFEAPLKNLSLLSKSATLLSVESGTTLIEANTANQYFYIVKSGLLRAVFITHQGREFSKEFYWENDIIFGI